MVGTLNQSDLEQRVLDAIDRDSCLDLISTMVPIGQPVCSSSIDPEYPPAREEDISNFIAAYLKSIGFSVQQVSKMEGRPNVVANWDDGRPGPTVILNDHMDTYPAGDPNEWVHSGRNPYNPTLKEDRYLYSRGTSDTRGNLACHLLALKALREAGVTIGGKITCAYCVDEERHGGAGAKFLLEEWGLKGDYEITVEPTSWTNSPDDWGIGIAVAHSGCCVLDIETRGVRSHIWRPDEGTNPILHMATLLETLRTTTFTHEAPKIYGPTQPSICPVRMEAGKIGEGQFTPPCCRARVWVVGVVPGMTAESIVADVRAVIDQLKEADPAIDASVTQVDGETFVPASVEVPDDSPHVTAISKAYQQVVGKDPVLYRKNAYCDTLRFSQNGIPSITFGPGEDGWPPVNEYIDMDKVVVATKIYALALLDLMKAEEV